MASENKGVFLITTVGGSWQEGEGGRIGVWDDEDGSSPQHPRPGPGEEASSPHPVLGSILLTSSGEAPELGNKGPPPQLKPGASG